jgi:hypothetical protein
MNRYTHGFITSPHSIEYYIYQTSKGSLMNLSGITQALETINIRPDEIHEEQLSEAFRILLQLNR